MFVVTREEKVLQERPDEYEHVVTVQALETFTNLMSKQGIEIGSEDGQRRVVFNAQKPLTTYLRRLKAIKVISSYSVFRIKKSAELIERG